MATVSPKVALERVLKALIAAGLVERHGDGVRAVAPESPAEGEPEAPGPKSWQASAIQTMRVQGIPVNPGSLELSIALSAPGWGSNRVLSDRELDQALQAAINRAKTGGNPVGLLLSILKRETASDILEGHEAVIPGKIPRDATNTTTGEGRHSWEPDESTKVMALLGHASKCRRQAAKKACPDDLAQELEEEAVRYEAEAARIGGAE